MGVGGPLSSDPAGGKKKKKSHWKEKSFPGEEKSCVRSAENAPVST